ncbi:MAG: hypothetical protein D6830_03135 [Ignavibacteria bacterium]|nr:MAG: hypothetical protein D6830_03135 [Ignavibacteria bacterium]
MEENNQVNQELMDDEEFELSHTDKLVGVFTEPKETFSKISKFPPKVVDWFLPLFLMIVVAVLSNVVMMSNPTIKYKIIDEQMTKMEERFDEMVESGDLTREQADAQLERTREFMEGGGAFGLITQAIGTVIFVFVFFFLISFVFHLLAKMVFKGEGSYSHSMVAYGLPMYISVIQIVLMVLAAMTMDKLFTDLSVASFAGMDKHTLLGFILSKVDVFSIWFYGVFAIGLAKMHKSNDTGKFMGLVYGTWIGFSLILFALSKAFPFFSNFIR